jgi:hypothetical protein
MREISTHIDIAAPASLVWAILADFGTYRRWNPLMLDVFGSLRIGGELELTLRSASGARVSERSTIVHLREPHSLRWQERARVPGMTSSERRFVIEPGQRDRVRFHHTERVHGLLAGTIGRDAWARRGAALQGMNSALKLRAERAWSGTHAVAA